MSIIDVVRHTSFSPGDFQARRLRVYEAIGPEACALLQAAPASRGFVDFRQSNIFFYLSGLEIPHAYLCLDGRARRTTAYVPPRGKGALAEGAAPGIEDVDLVRALSGVEEVSEPGQLVDDIATAKVIYVPHAPAEGRGGARPELAIADRQAALDPWDGEPGRQQRFIALLRSRLPGVEVRDLTPILDDMRSVKDGSEIDVLRRAGRLSALAVREAMRVTCPGLFEYQLGALANYIYRLNGARGHGYRPIIACGDAIWYAHYHRIDAPLRAGELVLMDGAPEIDFYTSDIGRMWPVDGRYTGQQRELYGFIVDYHRMLLERIRPGVLPGQVMDEAADVMRAEWEARSFSKPAYREAARQTLEFRGHLSHPVGMSVHDDGGYRHRPLQPGTVFAVDPQMWVPEERLYVRVEDTVVVTEDGIENLTAAAPLELDEVEALMAEEAAELPLATLA